MDSNHLLVQLNLQSHCFQQSPKPDERREQKTQQAPATSQPANRETSSCRPFAVGHLPGKSSQAAVGKRTGKSSELKRCTCSSRKHFEARSKLVCTSSPSWVIVPVTSCCWKSCRFYQGSWVLQKALWGDCELQGDRGRGGEYKFCCDGFEPIQVVV